MRTMIAIGAFCLAGLSAHVARAQVPVEFDTRRVFACTEVEPPQRADSARKVVLVVIPISANFNVPEHTVESLRYELNLPDSLTLLDHLPRTQTGSNVLVRREQRQEHELTDLNVSFGGGGRVGFSAFGLDVGVGGEGQRTRRDLNEVRTKVQVDRLPPRDQVIVTGTHNEGQTLYFDLKWHDQTTREGQTDFALLAEVPSDWTGDLVTLTCTARRDSTVVGRLTKSIGFYLGGDNAARQKLEEQFQDPTESYAGVNAGQTRSDNGLNLELVWCPPGTFSMGSPKDEPDRVDDREGPVEVTLSSGFWLGKYEVTQEEYRRAMGENPSAFASTGSKKEKVAGMDTGRFPVDWVSWGEALAFCRKLTDQERRAGRLPAGWEYSLPTEAQWEYACRSGTRTATAFGDSLSSREANFNGYLPYNGASEGPFLDRPTAVGSYRPNNWGLYDMHGNVLEWCLDEQSDTLRGGVDPSVPSLFSSSVLRGGSWSTFGESCRSASRGRGNPEFRFMNVGFRVAAVPSPR
ncbi:formylglycine-generating enzyme family protein [Tautonia rosea]|uniref:formylglycine-generating enzyme family protein n=1 Tax=Tautonia rosea TaxID=2728037 RepID=UPI0014737DE5|nr:formylglycine-generating enzyme family protein [Tautonia rosea]